MVQSVKQQLNNLLWKTDLLATRFTLAIAAIMTGILVAINPQYWILEGAYVVAFLFVAQGSLMTYSLLSGKVPTVGVYFDAMLGCVLWSAVCATNLFYEPWHYSDAAHLALAAASWWSLVRWEVRRD